MRRVRTFIALEIAEEVIREAEQVRKRLETTAARLRAVDGANMHLTIRFIGDFEELRLAELCAAARTAAAAVDPFELAFSGVGAFPRISSPRVIFLGCEDEPRGSLECLHDALEDELEPLGISRDVRRFKPHLTLARVKTPDVTGELQTILTRFSGFSAGSCQVGEISVFLSELTPDGPVYTRAGRAPLGG